MGTVTVRAPRPGDGSGLAQMHLGTSAYHVEIAPDVYRLPDEEGLVDFFERGIEEGSTTQDFLALVAEVDGEVAGYLQAQLLPPLETARWQPQRSNYAPHWGSDPCRKCDVS
jgi:hypothetical protein